MQFLHCVDKARQNGYSLFVKDVSVLFDSVSTDGCKEKIVFLL